MGSSCEQNIGLMLKQLRYVPGFAFTNDVSYLKFLDRVHEGEMKLRSMGLWEVPHPWLNIFVPKSRIQDLHKGVLKAILKPNNASMGPVLIYPINKNKYAALFQLHAYLLTWLIFAGGMTGCRL